MKSIHRCLWAAAAGLSLAGAAHAQTVYSSPVRDVDNPERSAPFDVSGSFVVNAPSTTNSNLFFVPVTAGKRSFFDFVSLTCVTQAADAIVAQLYINGFSVNLPLPTTASYASGQAVTTRYFHSIQVSPHRIYTDGYSVGITFSNLNSANYPFACTYALTGHTLN